MRSLIALSALFLMLVPIGARAQGAPLTGSGTAVQRISGQRIALAAAHAVATLPHDASHRYIAASMIPDQVVSAGRVALRAGSAIGTASFVNVPVAIDVNGRLDRTIYVGYRVQHYVETAVAAHDLVPGSVLTADDLTMARVPDTGRLPNGIEALLGRRIAGSVVKGQPIPIEATHENQIVQAGSTVVLIVRDSGVEVTADVVARTSGGMGDQVSVYNPSTYKALSGTVTAPGTVVLDISGGDR